LKRVTPSLVNSAPSAADLSLTIPNGISSIEAATSRKTLASADSAS